MKFLVRLALLLVALVWAGSFIFIKFGLEELDPFNLAFWRFFIAAPLLFAIVAGKYRKRLFSFRPHEWFLLVFLGLTGVSLLYVIQFAALELTTAINASILINSSVLFIAILSFSILGERMSKKRIAGIVMAFIGILVVISNGKLKFFNSSTFIGDVLMVFDGLVWAGYTIAGKKILESHQPDLVTAWAFVFGTLTMIPFLVVRRFYIPAMTLTWISLLYLAILCSIFAYLVWYWALEKEDASRVAVYIYLIPLFTAVMAYFVLNEPIGMLKIIGGFLTIVGIYLAES
jgi:drug/metabolite transporter (DMT)-like permease